MSLLKWDEIGERLYESGVSKGVIYQQSADGSYPTGVSWNGLTEVTENSTGGEPEDIFADNIKYASMMSVEQLGLTIGAYMYPDEFGECDGSVEVEDGVYINQQPRKPFGLVYRTEIGSDTADMSAGYKLHLIYGCKAAPSEKGYQSINDSPEAMGLSWEVNTTPVPVTGHKPTSSLVIDSTKVAAEDLATLEDQLFGKDPTTVGGTDGITANLPLPDAVIAMFA